MAAAPSQYVPSPHPRPETQLRGSSDDGGSHDSTGAPAEKHLSPRVAGASPPVTEWNDTLGFDPAPAPIPGAHTVFDPAAEPPYPDVHRPDEEPAPHALLSPVIGLLGTWRGRGRGGYPTLAEDFEYAQEVTFSHDGRPFLRYEARAWLLGADDAPLRPAARESGWWRLQPDGRVEALITQPTGIAEIAVGRATDNTVDLSTHDVALTPTAKEVDATRRRYALADDATLTFVHDLAAVGQPLQHHLSARLRRRD